jgi:hypothetical protein
MKEKNLLTSGKSNTKTAKNSMETYYLSLQPTNLNSKGENLCKFSTKECRTQCLQYTGRQGFSNVVKSRQRKTEMFVNNREVFLDKLWSELEALNKKGKYAVRLNLLSDVNWDIQFISVGKDLSKLSNIQLYDYTKDPLKVAMNNVGNYNFTFSYSGGNWKWCEKFLKEKTANVAMVFKNSVPSQYEGYKVVDGDLNDERYLDEKGVIVGLKYKVPRGVKYVTNKFVVDAGNR